MRPKALRSCFVKAVPLFHRGEVSNVSPRKATLNMISEDTGNIVFTSLCMMRSLMVAFPQPPLPRFELTSSWSRLKARRESKWIRCSPRHCFRQLQSPFQSHTQQKLLFFFVTTGLIHWLALCLLCETNIMGRWTQYDEVLPCF